MLKNYNNCGFKINKKEKRSLYLFKDYFWSEFLVKRKRILSHGLKTKICCDKLNPNQSIQFARIFKRCFYLKNWLISKMESNRWLVTRVLWMPQQIKSSSSKKLSTSFSSMTSNISRLTRLQVCLYIWRDKESIMRFVWRTKVYLTQIWLSASRKQPKVKHQEYK